MLLKVFLCHCNVVADIPETFKIHEFMCWGDWRVSEMIWISPAASFWLIVLSPYKAALDCNDDTNVLSATKTDLSEKSELQTQHMISRGENVFLNRSF